MMEMPTPCDCGNVVELNDMNTCDTCRNLYCSQCLPHPWTDCPNCQDEEET